jgi:hypothetical protein
MSPVEGQLPPCIHCGSTNVLPFEDDSPAKNEATLFIIVLSTVLMVTAYFIFVVSSYLYTPLVIFIAIIIVTRLINKHQGDRKKRAEVVEEWDYMCLDCSRSYRAHDQFHHQKS